MQIEADQAGQREVALAHALVGAMDLAVQAENQGEGVLRHGVRGVAWHADDGDSVLVRRRQVDVVEPGAPQGEQLDASGGEALERLGPEVVVDERADGAKAVG
jgi:hypothetical protein